LAEHPTARPTGPTMPVSALLRERAQAAWRAAVDHPFVRGLADGSLPPPVYARYLAQDYVFLIGYCRVFGLAAAKAAPLAVLTTFAGLLHETATTEMDLHRAECARYGLDPDALAATEALPTTRGYVDHLLSTAALSDVDVILAAVLPCQVGYAEVGAALAAEGADHDDNPYAAWVRAYADAGFQSLARQTAALLDRVADGASPARMELLSETFLRSCRYEAAFWEAAWNGEAWPTPA